MLVSEKLPEVHNEWNFLANFLRPGAIVGPGKVEFADTEYAPLPVRIGGLALEERGNLLRFAG